MTTTEKTVVAATGRPVRTPGIGDKKTWLVTIYPAGIGQALTEVPPRRFVIGRGNEADLMIADADVSREHCVIEPHDGQPILIDLNSTNGTFLNDQRVYQEPVECGDYIRIGSHILKFLSSDHVEVQYHETVYSMMIHDGLTGIHNRRFLTEFIKRELVRSTRHGRPLSVLMLDIDRFKDINDTYGHLAGDAVLRDLCRRIVPTIREDEVFARYGGEEFVVVLPEATATQAARVAERIRTLVAERPVELHGVSVSVTISIGISQTGGEESLTADQLIERADQKLFEAKQAGRNRVAF